MLKSQEQKYLIDNFSKFKTKLICGIVGSGLYGLVDAGLIWLVKPLLDDGFVAHNQNFLKNLPWILIFLFIARALAAFLSQYLLAVVAAQVSYNLKKRLFSKLIHYTSRVYDRQSPGEFITRIAFNTNLLSQNAVESISLIAREVITIIGLLIVMMIASPLFTFLYLLSMPLSWFILKKIGTVARATQFEVAQTTDQTASHLQEVIDGQFVVKSFNGYEHEEKRFFKLITTHLFYELKQSKVLAKGAGLIQLIGGAVVVLILTLSVGAGAERLTGGDFACLITAILGLLRPMKQLTKVHEKWQQALTIANILIELENYPLELVQLSIPLKNYNYDFLNKTSRLEFKNVSFYSPGEDGAQILRNISFTVEPGQTVAIVGPSGGGKSSLVSLVSRFYDYQGSITLDGVELRSIPLAQLRNSIGYVSQQITIFHDTVEANIAYGASNPDLSNVYKAAILAFAHDFIEQLPLGYQTILGSNQGGYKLSGGQRQRLALARVFYKQAPLIILDEATSALDNESEDKIQASLMNLVATASTLVVAHRLSTVINADKILVIDKGQIVEEGSHNELIKLGGLYASLYATAKKENAFA